MKKSLFLATLAFVGAFASMEFEDILPSDVPITMMERLTNDATSNAADEIEHLTPMGVIKGRRETTLGVQPTNSHFYAFRGIGYAEPPVGELRWAEPVDKRGVWPDGHLDATKFRPFCPQYDNDSGRVLGREDCLYLNIFTPYLPGSESAGNRTQPLPVFVFFHGGAFLRGSSSAHGPARLLAHDIVLVTLNYRLGALGFITTEDESLPGNYGMLDQVSALRWVQEHIAYFGGDASRVTIGGFSAGSASVHLHMASPMSKGLFHGGIMMSGSGNCKWTVRENLSRFAFQLGEQVGCSNHSSVELKKCLTGVPTEELLHAQADMHSFGFWPLPFVVNVDGGRRDNPFMPGPIASQPLTNVPILLGSVPDEGLLFAAGVILLSKEPSSAAAVYKEAVPKIIFTWPEESRLPLVRTLAEAFYYTERSKVSLDAFLEETTEMLSDYAFGQCVWDDAALFAKNGITVYTYLNTHRDEDTPTWATPLYERLRDLGLTTPILTKGVSHGDDMVNLFDFPYALGKFSDRDQRVSTFVTGAWANFVMSGSPVTGNAADLSWANVQSWEPLVPDQPVGYFNINPEPNMVRMPFRGKERNLWQQLMTRIPPQHMETSGKEKYLRINATVPREQHSCPITQSCHLAD